MLRAGKGFNSLCRPSTIALVLSSLCLASAAVDSPELGIPWLYKGLAVWAFSWAALDAFAIGANDVANSFANAVAAQTITYSQACAIACVAEFVGCIALGKNVTDTIRGKIVNVQMFKHDPYVLMLAMSCTSLGSSVWVLAATILNMPVSTTHATVGAVMGVGIASFGPSGVNWSYSSSGFSQIVASWFISPTVAGVLSSIIYLTVKWFILSVPDEISFKRGLWSLPFYTFVTFGIICGFMIFKGIPIAGNFSNNYEAAIPTVVGVGIGFGILSQLTVVPWVRRFICDNENLPWWCMPFVLCVPKGKFGYYEEGTHDSRRLRIAKQNANAVGTSAASPQALQMMAASTIAAPVTPEKTSISAPTFHQPPMPMPSMQMPGFPPQAPYGQPGLYNPYMFPQQYTQGTGFGHPGVQVVGMGFGSQADEKMMHTSQIAEQRPRVGGVPMFYTTNDRWYDTIGRKLAPGFYIDIEALCEECEELHSHANHFFDKTERLYKTLQVSTCSFSSLSHGANDIANSVGPLSAVWAIYTTGTLNSKSPVETWILAFGGAFLDLGLVTFGHNIMMTLGNKVTYQTPSRGFCMELGAMFTVLIFSKLGVPVSTTHCISGATAGVGLCNGDMRAINWKMVGIILGGWIITCPCAGIITGLIYWGLATTPHPTAGNGFF